MPLKPSWHMMGYLLDATITDINECQLKARMTFLYRLTATGKSEIVWGFVVVGVCFPPVSSFTRSER